MKFTRRTLSAALLAALVAPAAHAEVALDVIANSEVSFEGLVQADFYSFDVDTIDYGIDSSTDLDGQEYLQELRRAELVLKGKGPGNIEWVLGYDAKDDKFLDTNIKYKFGNNANHFLQLGQFKQPGATMEELSSTKNNDFVAKSSITNSLGTARRVGIQYNFGDANWALIGSYFSRELTRNREHGNGYSLRGYWAPVNEAGNVFHLGASYTDKDTDGDVLRLRARPMVDLVPFRYLDANLTRADRSSTLGVEGLWIGGPIKVQAEYMSTDVQRYGGVDDFSGSGYYVSGLWNLTGESWGYKAGVPTTGLPDDPGKGMWQLGLRFDALDLTDGTVIGGDMDSITVGMNWYWRSNFKFMLNYVMVNQERPGFITPATGITPARTLVSEDNPNILEARMQFYW